LKENEEKLKN